MLGAAGTYAGAVLVAMAVLPGRMPGQSERGG